MKYKFLSVMVFALSVASAAHAQVGQDFKDSLKLEKKSPGQTSSTTAKKSAAQKKAAPAVKEEEKNMGIFQAYVGGAGIRAEDDEKNRLHFLVGAKGLGIAPLSASEGFKTYLDYNADARMRFGTGVDADLNAELGVPIGLGMKTDSQGRSLFIGFRPGAELDFDLDFHKKDVVTTTVTGTDPIRGDYEYEVSTGGDVYGKGNAVGAILIGGRIMLMQKNDIKISGGIDYKNIFAATDEDRLGEGTQYSVSAMTPSLQALVSYGTYDLESGKSANELKIAANAKIYKNKDIGVVLGGYHKQYNVEGLPKTKQTGVTVGVSW